MFHEADLHYWVSTVNYLCKSIRILAKTNTSKPLHKWILGLDCLQNLYPGIPAIEMKCYCTSALLKRYKTRSRLAYIFSQVKNWKLRWYVQVSRSSGLAKTRVNGSERKYRQKKNMWEQFQGMDRMKLFHNNKSSKLWLRSFSSFQTKNAFNGVLVFKNIKSVLCRLMLLFIDDVLKYVVFSCQWVSYLTFKSFRLTPFVTL